MVKGGGEIMFPRKIYPLLKEHISKKQITVITGMRRTGKTTLLKQLLAEIPSKNKIYIDLERMDNREIFFEKNYDSIINILGYRGIIPNEMAYVAIDEIQLVPNIPSVIKYLYDNYNIKFFVSGSSSYYIKNLFTESLAGRKKIFELFPLDFGEFLIFKGIHYSGDIFFNTVFNNSEYERLKVYYEEYIEYGGFPEVVLSPSLEDKKDILSDIISSYINIDIKTLADFRNMNNLYKLMKLLAGRVGCRLDYVKLSSMAGLSRTSIYNYLDLLEKTYLICRLPVFTNNPDREIVKAQKLYFYDNGILNTLAEISAGSKFENAIFTQLHQKGELSYYSLKTGREIDFILNKKFCLEVKESPVDTDKKALANLSEKTGIKDFRLIGRHKSPNFSDYIWGGEIR